MKNQTAVEWLFSQLPYYLRLSKNGFDLLNQAKELEKQQIIEAYSNNGWNDEDQRANGEQYYNQTYKP